MITTRAIKHRLEATVLSVYPDARIRLSQQGDYEIILRDGKVIASHFASPKSAWKAVADRIATWRQANV